MKNGNIVILHSGGMDSSALIHFYKKMNNKVTSLFIDYGQISGNYEKIAVEKICSHYNIDSIKITIKSKTKFGDGEVIGRNFFLLSSALMYFNCRTGIIGIGIHAGTEYIDCSKDFLISVNQIFTLYSNGKIVANAPFIDMSKKEIFQYCIMEKVPLNITYSCERGKFPNCGKCGTCKEIKLLYDTQDN